MSEEFMGGTLSLISLMFISCCTFFISKKVSIPYTVLLFLAGIFVHYISINIPFFSFLTAFELTPEILFFVFLPVLLFESAYQIGYRPLLKNIAPIAGLSLIGLLISGFVIAFLMNIIFPIFGISGIPFTVFLLFGLIISATDTAAVLAIFKSIGIPRRLALIFEGESLFNDGTALAFFLIVLAVMLEGLTGFDIFTKGLFAITSMILGGIILGSFIGFIFSYLIGKIKNNESIEIIMTLIVANLTFLLAEIINHHHIMIGNFQIQVSAIIATTLAGIVVGNYGRYKISPQVSHHMEKFWEFFAFIANSIVFILMGLLIPTINLSLIEMIIPVSLAVIIVVIARAVSVYIPLIFTNSLNIQEKVPVNWIHLLAWGSLRGSLAIMAILMIPGRNSEGFDKVDNFQIVSGWYNVFGANVDIRDFLLVLVVGCIVFTFLIKATTLPALIRKLKIGELTELEQFKYNETKIYTYKKILEKLNNLHAKGYATEEEFSELFKKYESKVSESLKSMQEFKAKVGQEKFEKIAIKALELQSLGIEKQYLYNLFEYNEIDEMNFKNILNKVNRQIERIESDEARINDGLTTKIKEDFFQRLGSFFNKETNKPINIFFRNRAKLIISRKVIKELESLKSCDFGFDTKYFDEVIAVYQKFYETAKQKREDIFANDKFKLSFVETGLIDKSLIKEEEHIIEKLHHKEFITPKIYAAFVNEIEEGIFKDVKNVG